ncbi:MAG: hypothetical protein ACQCN5_01460 [Candidatus Bathyarchaeia archaeon]
MPISQLFAVVFVVAITFALWKLRRKGKVYRYMFYGAAVLGTIILAALVAMTLFSAPIGPGQVEVTVNTDKPSYTVGEQVHINVQVNNYNDWTVPAPSEIIYRFISNQTNKGFRDTYYQSDFAPHAITNIQLNDHNFFTQPGNYKIAVTLYGDFDYSPTKEVTITINPA